MSEKIGILMKGKSLEKLSLISDKFDECFVVNWEGEAKKFRKDLAGKGVTYVSNWKCRFKNENLGILNINRVFFPLTKNMSEEKLVNIFKQCERHGMATIDFLSDEHEDVPLRIRNTGVGCVFYVSLLKPKEIWIAGLDFYYGAYLLDQPYANQFEYYTKEYNLIDSFVRIVKEHPDIQYNILTYCKKLPKLDNLNILDMGE